MDWFLLALISAVFSALSAVSEKKALIVLHPIDFSFIVSLITLVFSIPFIIEIELNGNIPLNLSVLFIKSLLNAAAFLCVMISIKNLEISEALPLLALSPGIVAVLGVIFINDYLNFMEWLGVCLMVAGAYFLEVKRNQKITDPIKSLVDLKKYSYVWLALLFFTISSLLDRLLLKDFKVLPATFMAFQQMFYALIFTAVIIYRKKSFVWVLTSIPKKIFYIVLLISFLTVIYRYAQIEAVKLAPVALVLTVKRISVLLAIIIGGNFFKEKNILQRAIAALIILCGITLLALSPD